MADLPMLRTRDVAAELSVDQEVVRTYIRAGYLAAVNVATPGCKRPRWRVAPDELEAVKRLRGSRPPKTTRPGRKPRQPANVIKFY